MNVFSIVSCPYYLWKIEIPKKISASVQCVGDKYGTSQNLKALDVELRWDFELTEAEQVHLKNGEKVKKSPIFELIEKNSKGILKEVLEDGELGYVALGQKDGGTAFSAGWIEVGEKINEFGTGYVTKFVQTFGCSLEKISLAEDMGEQSYIWIPEKIEDGMWTLGEIEGEETSVWLDECYTDKEEEEVTCDLKVIIRNC